jgi:hypothetical protein
MFNEVVPTARNGHRKFIMFLKAVDEQAQDALPIAN